HQTRAIADEERRRRKQALLRLTARVHRRAGPRDLAHQRLVLALQARDELLLDLLRAPERGIARRHDGALERGGEPLRLRGKPRTTSWTTVGYCAAQSTVSNRINGASSTRSCTTKP